MNADTEAAAVFARHAHGDQLDKAGCPYLGHLSRVAELVREDKRAECVAWLHDVLEDTKTSSGDLYAAGFSREVVMAVQKLTRTPGLSAERYYREIRWSPLALKVKLADIHDNLHPRRLAVLEPNVAARLRVKYAKALLALSEKEE